MPWFWLQVYWWHDKYRPRKPKYFNRVHTGYEWNKYNQTHYDHDNPPPKVGIPVLFTPVQLMGSDSVSPPPAACIICDVLGITKLLLHALRVRFTCARCACISIGHPKFADNARQPPAPTSCPRAVSPVLAYSILWHCIAVHSIRTMFEPAWQSGVLLSMVSAKHTAYLHCCQTALLCPLFLDS